MAKQRRRKIPVTAEERQIMLWWWTVFGGNYNKTAKKVSEVTGIQRSRKVVFEVAKKYNFQTLSHIVRDQVNKEYYGDSSPGMTRMMKMAMDLMEMDEEILAQAKTFLKGGNGKCEIQNFTELLNGLKYVTADFENITGKKGIKKNGFEDMAEQAKPEVAISVKQILKELSEEDRMMVTGAMVDEQHARILNYKE